MGRGLCPVRVISSRVSRVRDRVREESFGFRDVVGGCDFQPIASHRSTAVSSWRLKVGRRVQLPADSSWKSRAEIRGVQNERDAVFHKTAGQPPPPGATFRIGAGTRCGCRHHFQTRDRERGLHDTKPAESAARHLGVLQGSPMKSSGGRLRRRDLVLPTPGSPLQQESVRRPNEGGLRRLQVLNDRRRTRANPDWLIMAGAGSKGYLD